MDKLLIKAPAKINLGLRIVRRRHDGYHDLETVMQQISLADILVIEKLHGTGEISLTCSNPELNGRDNLVYRAAESLAKWSARNLPSVKLTLIKNIPVAAGLAGGSSDAAAALKGLGRLWNLDLPEEELYNLAAELGSDLPYCLKGGTVLATGRGDQLKQLPDLPFYWVVVAVPGGIMVSTAEAYRSFDRSLFGKPDLSPLIDAVRDGNREMIMAWLSSGLTNTLESAEVAAHERIEVFRSELRSRGLVPIFSGSGPALFMLFDDLSCAAQAAVIAESCGGRVYLCWTLSGERSKPSV